jgi:glycosyltransferase involved in cell wall biosynthesis
LVNQPARQWTKDPDLVALRIQKDSTPTYSIVMPVHNQSEIICKVLDRVIEYTLGSFEIMIILDGCTDATKANLLQFMQQLNPPSTLVALVIIENIDGIFETSCDNQGFVSARGEFIVEIQADMLILTFGYNVILSAALRTHTDLIAVSGRCCHTLGGPEVGKGKLGEMVQSPHKVLSNFEGFNKIYLSHTVNRGPLVIRRTMLEELGFLDEKHYVLGNDEHDLFARAWYYKMLRTGFIPIEVFSPLVWGSTRRPRLSSEEQYLRNRQKNQTDGFLFKNNIKFPPYEEREFGKIDYSLLS